MTKRRGFNSTASLPESQYFFVSSHPNNMIIYNTTYTMPTDDARNFVIWVHQSMLPRVAEDGMLSEPKLRRILSHRDQDSECFSLQFEVESTALLHRWYTRQGEALNEELRKMFEERIVGFSTIMEEIIGD